MAAQSSVFSKLFVGTLGGALVGGLWSYNQPFFFFPRLHAEELEQPPQINLSEENFIPDDKNITIKIIEEPKENIKTSLDTSDVQKTQIPKFKGEIVEDYVKLSSKYEEKHRKYGCLRFGAPSDENIKYREGYVCSYNRKTRTANWVGESLKSENLRNATADRVNSTFKEVYFLI